MIDNIGVARLPEFGVNRVITEEIGAYIYGDTDTIDEAYDKTLQRLKQYDFSSY